MQSFLENLQSTIAWLVGLIAGLFGAFAQWLGGVLAGLTGAPVSPQMAELIAFGVAFSVFILVLAFLRLLSERSRARAKQKPRRTRPPTKKEMLAEIEKRMVAIKAGYKSGAIAEDVYLTRTRTLYERAQKLLDQ